MVAFGHNRGSIRRLKVRWATKSWCPAIGLVRPTKQADQTGGTDAANSVRQGDDLQSFRRSAVAARSADQESDAWFLISVLDGTNSQPRTFTRL